MKKLIIRLLTCITVLAVSVSSFALKQRDNGFRSGGSMVAAPVSGGAASTISGKLTMGQCYVAPKIYLNNRKTRAAFTKFSGGFLYSVNVASSVRRVNLKIVKQGCRGRWTPNSKRVLLANGYSRIRNVNFQFKGAQKEIRIPTLIIAAIINSQFKGTKVRLNNYGPRHGYSWYKGGDSYVKLPGALGGGSKSFSIPPVNKFPFRYYVNDVKLSSLQASISGPRILLSLNFESQGAEIKGRCASKSKAKNLPCTVTGSDNAAPDIQMNSAKAMVYLAPVARNGSISYSLVQPDFTANIQAQGICKLTFGLCNKVFGYKGKIKSGVKSALNALLNNNVVRNKIASSLKPLLRKYGVRNVVSVRVIGSEFVILHK